VLAYLADQLQVNPMSLIQYVQDRETMRFEHLAELQRVYEFRSFSAQTYRELVTRLLPLALTTGNGVALIEGPDGFPHSITLSCGKCVQQVSDKEHPSDVLIKYPRIATACVAMGRW
jgi:Domain of unknown function (DUF4158)